MLDKFPTYKEDQLPAILLNGISPQSMTYDFDSSHIRMKKLKQFIPHDYQGDCFCAGTLERAPVFRFRVGQEIDVDNPYTFNSKRAMCIGELKQQIKGMRVIGYFFVYID